MKTENKKYLKMIYKLLLVVLGNATYALAVKLFILPNDLMTGGTTGIALVINHYFNGVSISAFVLGFNILMLLVGLGIGVGLGIVIRNGASTGGMDIPPLVLNRYFKIPVSVSLYVFDMCILLGQAVYNPLEGILYGILLILVYSVVLDKLMLMGTTRTEVKVVSGHAEEIRKVILSEVDRGVTLLYGESGYLQQDTQVILSIVSNRELPQVEKLIHSIDPESFMIISRVSEVRGRGFSMSKEYK